ncbi:MAG: hypothetical protein IH944_06515 [Armatimonadetes bacterium]|nr:hypothetical protein [Armatimonadota bacterium]
MLQTDTNLQWEKLKVAEPKHEFSYGTIYRGKVPGGWLITMFWTTGHSDGGVTMTFMPDSDHSWDGGTLPN